MTESATRSHETLTGAGVCSLRRALKMSADEFAVKVMGSKGSPETARKWVRRVEKMSAIDHDLDVKIRRGVIEELRKHGYVTRIKFVLDQYTGPGSALKIATAVDLHVSIVRAVLGFIRSEDRHGRARLENGAHVGKGTGHPRHRACVQSARK